VLGENVLVSGALQLDVRVGCAGWNIPKEFASEFASDGTHLQRYSRQFFCTEINSSFYRAHRSQTWQRWAESVPENFQFSVKAPRAITHESLLHPDRAQLNGFLQQVHLLGKKLGPILFQLPPAFGFDARRTSTFLALLREMHNEHIAFEPRHESWFQCCVGDLFAEFRVARVAADPGIIPSATEPGGWNGLLYFRLHGSPRKYYSAYGSDFLRSLATRMTNLSRVPQVWCVFDNTASGAAIGNALELQTVIALSKEETHVPLRS
jgi:uncharacterized protein YecE (DUF72 family)